MPYVPLALPPGMWRNGTIYQAKNRWYNGDRVRWYDGLLRPIGGWRRFETDEGPLDQIFTGPGELSRNLLAWRRNNGDAAYVIATNNKLYAFKNRLLQTVSDITPTAFVAQPVSPTSENGYGNWNYGSETYGTERPVFAITRPFNWCLRTWGENLLALPRNVGGQHIYEWDGNLSNIATPINTTDAPTGATAMHVTEQRIVMVAGDAAEPRLIKWSDSENNSDWTPTVSNQAGSQFLPGRGIFLEITDYRDQLLLISETDLHVGRYIGPPYVFGFDKAGDNCGAVSGDAVVNAGRFVVWPGIRNFYIYDGEVQKLDCDVLDALSDILTRPFAGIMTGFHNTIWSEVWWFYASADSAEIDSYVLWNYKENYWATGTLERTSAALGVEPGEVLMMGKNGYLYEHELQDVIPVNTLSSEVYVETGPIELANGDRVAYISDILPDLIESGSVNISFLARDHPSDTDTEYGPYNVVYPTSSTELYPVSTRVRGRAIRMKINGDNGLWSLGNLRLNMRQGGRR